MEFRLCPWNNITNPVTHECLNRRQLRLIDGTIRWYLPTNRTAAVGIHDFQVILPYDVLCEQCVFQWKYHAGNSWGVDEEGEGLGYGHQEEFYGCSDIAIQANNASNRPQSTTTQPETSTLTTQSNMTSTQPSTTTNVQPTTYKPPTPSTYTPPEPSTYMPPATSTAVTPAPTTTKPAAPSPPVIDCSKAVSGQVYFYTCTSFYRCVFAHPNPYIFDCPQGTVCASNGRCVHAFMVPPPCGNMDPNRKF
uniref:Uncharacterized protein LOC104265352 n=1 Tax=Phallusia mammillata TaxID=59560 RepID=A0A6F9DJ14_9ASCI|nr:uncharacterized protein LOC104265352 [Phallusia mammillata]